MKLLTTIVTVALASLVLVSSSSFSIAIHLCAGEIQQVGLFEKQAVCDRQALPPCHKPLRSCCENETIVHQADDIKPSLTQLHFVGPEAIDVPFVTPLVSEIVPSEPLSRTGYVRYKPPLRWEDITVAHRVLLI
ncbi:MAG TPA: hypothetical protein VF490_05730 [Chryseosolibacter sp.]